MPTRLDLLAEIAEKNRQATRRARAAVAMTRWLLVCPLVFGLAAIYCAHRAQIDAGIVLCTAMMVCCILGLMLDFPAIARHNELLGLKLTQLECELTAADELSETEQRVIRARLVRLEG